MKLSKKTYRVADVSYLSFSGYEWDEYPTLAKAMEAATDLIDCGAEQVSIVPPGYSIHGAECIQIDARGVECA